MERVQYWTLVSTGLVLASLVAAACFTQETRPAHGVPQGSPKLVVDMSEMKGKAYVVSFQDGRPSIAELLPDTRLKWMIGCGRRRLLCSAANGGKNEMISMDIGSAERSSLGGVPRALPDTPEGDVSPDGKRMCFRWMRSGKEGISVMEIETGRIEEVFSSTGPVSPPSWSPGGTAVAYYFGTEQSYADDGFQVAISDRLDDKAAWEQRVVGPASKKGSRSPSRTSAPIWACNGAFLVFQARYHSEEVGLQTYAVRSNGRDLIRIGGPASRPSAHPDGKSVVCVSVGDGRVFAYDLESRTERLLFRREGAHSVKISPDGKNAAYSDTQGRVIVANADGSQPRVVLETGQAVVKEEFCWVP